MPPVCVPRPTTALALNAALSHVSVRASLMLLAQPASEALSLLLGSFRASVDSFGPGPGRKGKCHLTWGYWILTATPRLASGHGIDTEGIAISPSSGARPLRHRAGVSSWLNKWNPPPSSRGIDHFIEIRPQQHERGAIKEGNIGPARARISAYARCISRG